MTPFFLRKLVIPVLFLLSLTQYSCRPDRLICSYAVRNKVVERQPQTIDEVRVEEVFHSYDRNNRSYLELGKYSYNGKQGIILASDLFNDPVRFNIFAGFTRGFSIYDKYEKVNHLLLDTATVKTIVNYWDKLKNEATPNMKKVRVDYNVTKDVFITYYVSYDVTPESKMVPYFKEMTVWMNGRRHEVNPRIFIKKLKEACQ